MTAHTDRSRSRKKKIWTTIGVAALAAAVAGVGALSPFYTYVRDNVFTTTVPEEYDPSDPDTRPDGGYLVLTGDAIDHPFDSSRYLDSVDAFWTLENRGAVPIEFDGDFRLHTDIDPELAAVLEVYYGIGTEADGAAGTIDWQPAGTIAAPDRTFAEALGIDEIAGDETIPVAVSVVLVDPTGLADVGDLGDDLRVKADFRVSYLDPLA
jgi:hypothetical protein